LEPLEAVPPVAALERVVLVVLLVVLVEYCWT